MPKTKGKLIVIEGPDGTGKETQSKLLLHNLNTSGVLGEDEARLISFPDYWSEWGRKIRAHLDGDPEYAGYSVRKIAELYARDRENQKSRMEAELEAGNSLVCDRYVESNMAYQGAKISNDNERLDFYEWLLSFEYEGLKIPRPDLVIVLRLNSHIVQKHLALREQFDIYEADASYQKRVHAEYERLASGYYRLKIPGNWVAMNCSEGGEQLLPEEIAGRIWKHVERLF